MTGRLLLRGMIVGLIAAVLAFGVARVIGEPQVELAIAFETALAKAGGAETGAEAGGAEAGAAHSHDHAAADTGSGDAAHVTTQDAAHSEIFSRATQSGLGLFTGLMVYGAALGGLFALVFAFAWGRIGDLGPRGTAALLAVLGFTAVILVPGLKYPSNPPAVGDAATIGLRTQAYFGMLVLSCVGMGLAVWAARRLSGALGVWNGTVLAGLGYVVAMTAVALVLPGVDEVPPGFPASLLWQFRIASLGIQAVLWAGIGLGFGYAAEAALLRRTGALRRDYRSA